MGGAGSRGRRPSPRRQPQPHDTGGERTSRLFGARPRRSRAGWASNTGARAVKSHIQPCLGTRGKAVCHCFLRHSQIRITDMSKTTPTPDIQTACSKAASGSLLTQQFKHRRLWHPQTWFFAGSSQKGAFPRVGFAGTLQPCSSWHPPSRISNTSSHVTLASPLPWAPQHQPSGALDGFTAPEGTRPPDTFPSKLELTRALESLAFHPMS